MGRLDVLMGRNVYDVCTDKGFCRILGRITLVLSINRKGTKIRIMEDRAVSSRAFSPCQSFG